MAAADTRIASDTALQTLADYTAGTHIMATPQHVIMAITDTSTVANGLRTVGECVTVTARLSRGCTQSHVQRATRSFTAQPNS